MANSRTSSPASSNRSSVQPPEQDPTSMRPTDDIQPCPVGYMSHTPPPPPSASLPSQQPASISSSGCSSSLAGYPTREELQMQQQQLEQQAMELRQREERLHEQWQQMMLPPPAPPNPVKKERKLPIRSGSTASLFSPFASLSRRLGAKHKSSKTSGSMASGMAPHQQHQHSRMSTPVEYANCPPMNERPSLASIYSTFPRKHHSSSSSASSAGRTPFISQLVNHHASSGGSSTTTTGGHCPSCPSPGPSYSSSSRVSSAPIMMTEVLDEPAVEEEGAGERVTWEYHHVTMNRVPGYGFGIAVSGGRDNPHFANGDPSIAISDVIKGGPAEGKLLINDRVMSVNGISLENVDYGTAVSVLRDSGAVVSLVVKRRIVLAACHEPVTYKVTLTKSKKKDDFGVILGSRIYLKELTNRALIERDGPQSAAIQEGDIVLKINSTPTEGMSLKEARKLMESCKDKLQLTIRREPGAMPPTSMTPMSASGGAVGGVGGGGPTYDATYGTGKEAPSHFANYADRPNYCNQNLYVQPPTRGGSVDYRNPLTPQPPLPVPPNGYGGGDGDKTNLSRLGGRSRGPVVDVSLSQLDHHHHMNGHGPDDTDAPPRPPPPRSDDYYSPRRSNEPPSEPLKPPPTLDPRFITFQKEGSVGIRLTGGNQVGIFVTAVQPGSPAAVQGLVPGDKILKVNDMEMSGVTREEAVLFLLSLQDQIELVVQHKRDEYDQVVASGHGDSFYVKTHFNYEQPANGHMSFRKGEVFHVVDTLYKGVVGSWQAYRVGPNGQDLQQGVIPNSAGAEELATAQFNAAKKEAATTTSESRGSFFRRRRPTHRRSKSLGRDHWDDVVFAETLSKFPAYERVVLRHPGFIRPVVLFGPIADIAREKLIKDFPDKFSAPQIDGNRDATENGQVASARSGIVRLSAIRELVDKGRHALLDITPGAVDKLNYAQFYPVVIFLRADSKHTVKELRAGTPKTAHKSSKKLYEQCVKLEKLWSHAFTTTVPLTQRDTWYRKLREAIDREQNQAIWVSEAKLDEYLSDDFLFPMTSRLSYASSPESDIDLSPEPRPGAKLDASINGRKSPASPANNSRLVKSSSDPSICTQDDLGVSGNTSASGAGGLLSTVSPKFLTQMSGVSLLSAVETSTPSKRRSHGGDSKYGFSSPISGGQQARENNTPRSPRSSSYNGYPYNGRQQDYMNGSHPPPRSMGSNGGYPPPPPPQQQQQQQHYGGYPQQQQQQQQQQQYGNGVTNGSEVPPPKIDRSSKPRGGNQRSAQERLFGSRDGDMNEIDSAYPTSPPAPPNGAGPHPSHDYLRGSSLDRAAKAGSYDSSSSSYESYNRLGLALGLGQHPSDPATAAGALPGSPSAHNAAKSHDPYRYTRSTSQPVRSPAEPTSPATKQHIRPFEHKKPSPPPPKTAPYKPVPPPKPKNYRPPPNAASSASSAAGSSSQPSATQQQPVTSNSNYWNHSPPGTLTHPHRSDSSSGGQHSGYYGPPNGGTMHNGSHYNRYDDDPNGGFDSGHGSSLDRHSYGGPNSLYGKAPPPPPPVNGSRGGGSGQNSQAGQYYYNIPPPRDQRDPGRLDLAQHRDQRGSAFELYKKPSDPRSPAHGHQPLYMEHNARTLDYYHDGDGDGSPRTACYRQRPTNDDDYYRYSPPTSPPPPNCTVIAAVRGWLVHDQGGRLESVETGVALIVPPGALPPSLEPHLVYFKVCRQDNSSDDAKGESLLSPLVQCGPKGLRFLKPVELRIPHQGTAAKSGGKWNVSLKASNELGQWRQISQPGDDRPDSDDAKYSRNYLSAFVDHF